MKCNAMSIEQPIRSRLNVRLKRCVRKYGAGVVWIAVACGLAVLIAQRPQYGETHGVTELVETAIAPAADGVVGELAVDLLEEIRTGQVVAVLDDSAIRAEQSVADAELARLEAQLTAEQAELQRTAAAEERKDLDARRRFAMNEEQARLECLQMTAQQNADKIELERLQLGLQREEALFAKDMTSRESYDDARLHYERLQKKIEENQAAIASAVRMRDEAAARQAALGEQPPDPGLDYVLEPMRKAIDVQEARLAEIQTRRAGLVLTAPGNGQVTRILKRKGETARAGEPIAMLRLTNSMRVVAYINEKSLCDIPVGAHARICSQYRPELATEAEVVRVGAQIEPLPERLQLNPMAPEFGVIVLLAALKEPVFYPGERVKILIRNAR